MCPPVIAAATLALSAVSTVSSIQGQKKQARAQADYAQKQADSSLVSYRNTLDQLARRENQERASASQRIAENARQGLMARSAVRNSAADAGVSGITIDSLVRDLRSRELGYADSVRANFENVQGQIQANRESAATGTQSQINSIQAPRPVDYWGPLGQFAGVALDTYDRYQRDKHQSGAGSMRTD